MSSPLPATPQLSGRNPLLDDARFSAYRIMWLMVLFDLPTETAQDRREYAQFRKKMLNQGFTMFQFSVYIRHCMGYDQANAYVDRVKRILPPYGHVGIIRITDKQFGDIELFYGREPKDPPDTPQQLTLF